MFFWFGDLPIAYPYIHDYIRNVWNIHRIYIYIYWYMYNSIYMYDTRWTRSRKRWADPHERWSGYIYIYIYIYLDSIYRYFDTYSFHCNMDPSQKCIPAYPPSPYPSFHINSPLNCHFGAQVWRKPISAHAISNLEMDSLFWMGDPGIPVDTSGWFIHIRYE